MAAHDGGQLPAEELPGVECPGHRLSLTWCSPPVYSNSRGA